MVDALPHIFLRHLQAQLFAGLIEARQTVLGDGGLFAVDKGDAAVAAGPCLPHQRLQAGNVVREDGHAVVEHMVDGDDGHLAVHQLHHLRVVEVHAGNHHAVHIAVAAVLQIAHALAADVVVDESDVVAVLFRFHLETVQHSRKVLVGQAALPFVHKQNAQIVGAVGLEGTGGGVGQVAHAVRSGPHPLPGGGRDVRLVVQRLADRCHRYAAFLGQIFQGRHHFAASFRKYCAGMFSVDCLIVFAIS